LTNSCISVSFSKYFTCTRWGERERGGRKEGEAEREKEEGREWKKDMEPAKELEGESARGRVTRGREEVERERQSMWG
jgi:hypothetical protein